MKNLKLIVVTAAQRVISQYLEFLICHGSVATRETALEMRIHPHYRNLSLASPSGSLKAISATYGRSLYLFNDPYMCRWYWRHYKSLTTDRLLMTDRLTLCNRYNDRLSDAYYKLITTHWLMLYIYSDHCPTLGIQKVNHIISFVYTLTIQSTLTMSDFR